MLETSRKALFFALVLPAVVRAVLRVAWLERRVRLDELARRLRRTEAFRLRYFKNPRYLAASVERLLALGGRSKRCWVQSLLLLDLWSRCGLEPRLSLGVVRSTEDRHFHAWVTCGDRREGAARHREFWVG